MKINKITTVTNDVVRLSAAACARLAAPTTETAGGFAVRVMPPVTVQGPQESSALRTDGITVSRSGHLPWIPPV